MEDDDAQGVLQLASLGGTVATGERAGKRVRKVVLLRGWDLAAVRARLPASTRAGRGGRQRLTPR